MVLMVRPVAPSDKIAFEHDLVEITPALRRFATRFTVNQDDIDDLVQTTLLRALNRMDLFTPGTSVKSWTFTILRNHFMSEFSRRRREPNLGDDHLSDCLHAPPSQEWAVEKSQIAKVVAAFPERISRPLMLVAAGESYGEVAAACGCEVGTVKSRVSRARAKLTSALGREPALR